ncbi:DUF2804 domain-containing protein [Amnimonas aquatica]|uniref:DUF2804 domain-containing protein n=1 Tax=Amnimonas aquatica TaxID=2094561 RepID=A0A2P6AUM8_9GAMM|nr:DUF2804 domain-containing protein [Amnimonas aquatica]PQA50197.1 DUF2804 domain-containing protein [Amnimonas aquatica]
MLTPGHLLQDDEPRFGRFSDSLRHADGRADAGRDAFGRARGALARELGYKQFQYFGGMSDTLIFGCALVDLGHSNSVFVYVVDTATGEIFKRSLKRPGHWGMTLADNPVAGRSHFRGGDVEASQHYRESPRGKSLSVRVGDELEIEADMAETAFEPMSLCTRAGYQGWVYANKTAGLPLTGHLTWRGIRHDLRTLGAMGHHDFSCGYMRRETFWNWACLSGLSSGSDGRPVALGLNISCGVNETTHSENCLWLDGALVPVAGASFDFHREDVLAPWHVTTLDDAVDLRFTPLGLYQERLNLGLIASNFRQVFGRFDGQLRVGGREYPVHGLSGFVEDQFVRW